MNEYCMCFHSMLTLSQHHIIISWGPEGKRKIQAPPIIVQLRIFIDPLSQGELAIAPLSWLPCILYHYNFINQ